MNKYQRKNLEPKPVNLISEWLAPAQNTMKLIPINSWKVPYEILAI